MKKLILIFLTTLSACHGNKSHISNKYQDTSKEALTANYMRLAKQTEEYKTKWEITQRILIDIDIVKDKPVSDQNYIVDEFNNNIGSTLGSVDNIKEVQEKLKNQGSNYLKVVQLKIVAEMALNDASEIHAEIDTSK